MERGGNSSLGLMYHTSPTGEQIHKVFQSSGSNLQFVMRMWADREALSNTTGLITHMRLNLNTE